MNGLILLTAMSATGGLFGGHQARTVCVGGSCGTMTAAPARVAYAAAPVQSMPAPVQYYAYAPTPQAAPAPAPAPQQVYYPTAPVAPMVSYQSYYSVGSACATGNCPRR